MFATVLFTMALNCVAQSGWDEDAGFRELSAVFTRDGGLWTGTVKQGDKTSEVKRVKAVTKTVCDICKIPAFELNFSDFSFPWKRSKTNVLLAQSRIDDSQRMARGLFQDEFVLTVKRTDEKPELRYECLAELHDSQRPTEGIDEYEIALAGAITVVIKGDSVSGTITGTEIPAIDFAFSRVPAADENSKPLAEKPAGAG